MNFRPIVTTSLSAVIVVALAVTAALLPAGTVKNGSMDLKIEYRSLQKAEETKTIEDFRFPLPVFRLPGGGQSMVVVEDSHPAKQITLIRRPSVTLKHPDVPKVPDDVPIGTDVPQADPIQELIEHLINGGSSNFVASSGLKLDLKKPVALEVGGRDDLTRIRLLKATDLLNPNTELQKLLDSNPNLTQPRKLPFEEKPDSLKIYDILHAGTGEYFEFKKYLLAKCNRGACSSEELKGTGFLLANEGRYTAAREMYDRMESSQLKADVTSAEKKEENKIKFEISGRVVDAEGKGIKSVRIKSLDGAAQTTTDEAGEYSLTLPGLLDLYKIRVNASKPGYSTATIPLDLISSDGIKFRRISGANFTLNKPVKSVILNNQTGKIISGEASVENGNFIVTTEWSRYQIPFDGFVHRNGTPFSGEIEAFLFEFDKESNIDQLLVNDIFDDLAGYAGDIMKTFGMPFILFLDKNGEAIHILKSNPMILKSKISEMEALRTNQDQVYEELTDTDLEFLIAKSDEIGGYPIDRKFLIDNNLVRFPCFWVYDQLKGVWENVGVKVISVEGETETIFYTLNDVD